MTLRKEFGENEQLFDALMEVISPEAIDEWLQRPNKRFGGSTPQQVIERGEPTGSGE